MSGLHHQIKRGYVAKVHETTLICSKRLVKIADERIVSLAQTQFCLY